MQAYTDEELLFKYRTVADPRHARLFLDELFRRLLTPAALFCYRWTGDHEWAADLAQEVLMQVYRRLDSFRGDAKLSTWVYSIARNHCSKAMRAKASAMIQMDDVDFPVTTEDPYARLVRESSLKSLRVLLEAALTKLEIQVITLHYGEDMPVDEITRLLHLSNTCGAKAYIVSAKRKLRAIGREQYRTGQRLGSRRPKRI